MQRLQNPFPLFLDARNSLLDAGYIYIGAVDGDPELSPINVYWDEAKTQLAAQPLRTLGGLIVNGSTPSQVFIDADDYSMRVRDADSYQVSYSPSVTFLGDVVDYMPTNATLEAIAAMATQPYGLGLLAITNDVGLRAYAGISAGLATTGGTISGNITRQGGGSHLYWVDSAHASGRVFVTAAGASDPTSQPGDLWIELAP